MEATLRMIVLSPLDAEADRIAQELRRTGYVVDAERVDNGLALRSALGRRPCDVIVSEWSLRHFSAPAAIEMVNGLGLDVPVVILTGTFGEEMAIGAFRAGARDFLLREQIHKLPAVVEREIRLHRARAGARESQSLNRVMLAAAPDGIIEMDRSGDIVEFNPAAEKIFAYSREESLGKPFADLLSAPALWHAHRRDLERALPVVARRSSPGASRRRRCRRTGWRSRSSSSSPGSTGGSRFSSRSCATCRTGCSSAGRPKSGCAWWRSTSATRRRWKRSATWRAAWRTTSTT